MAVLKIITGATNKILRTKSEPVKRIDKKTKKLIADMIETLRDCDGLGLAASQIGVNARLYIARLNYQTKNEALVIMINAELIESSDKTADGEEGCLSLPGKFGIVRRATEITVRYLDRRGKANTLNLEGLNARIIQHEIDHLDGVLIADKMQRAINPEELKTKPEI